MKSARRIGLEVHAQLNTPLKLFSIGSTCPKLPPNTVDAFDIALPGTLPVLNVDCVRLAVKAAIALNCQLQNRISFDRKHYIYPDTPMGYQITQKRLPYAFRGSLAVGDKQFSIRHIQIEQDTGKTTTGTDTLIDYNRANTALLEIVTDPCFESATDAVSFLRRLISLLKRNGVCLGDMESGHVRCDVNISVDDLSRTEVKNLNSFKHMQNAIEFEFERQTELRAKGLCVARETLGYNQNAKQTYFMRSKEDPNEYRFLPEFDLVDYSISEDFIRESSKDINKTEVIDELLQIIPLPQAKRLITSDSAVDIFYNLLPLGPNSALLLAKWITNDIFAAGANFKQELDTVFKEIKLLYEMILKNDLSLRQCRPLLAHVFQRKLNNIEIGDLRNLAKEKDLLFSDSDRTLILNRMPQLTAEFGESAMTKFMNETRGLYDAKQVQAVFESSKTSEIHKK